ncbi:tRNA (adenosine(37)-N6)-threonylcarbamoyltransferase complex dimerization subunit type 1 TsaB [Rossellomorea vietnamensis]|uniref:tRNA (Adenosine(37)-N6)-threonylcarbamoyltransferase complex dimerization subunit type 1 TsaB n=1 Tax=Rossellomorea vietnamensis TaxID=218284 RepID=A0A5D4M626_9BACI|nr:tRNA (adenosine(37)-N6)-threonylcarbamoyltransferase complex dimerization subunit type 1 TsaB [Rossellomorea vietnamensis]TYR97374.1 tRNA (adenosine(37)-N6)-threonylcarbamoyltransferase complex dimerization subunit type 1 TsaB [Rossellomorea vietnamensis]
MKILGIDTSNYQLGIALTDENEVIGEFMTNIKKNHSLRAMPAVEMLMKECGIAPADLDKIVVANGPGSYTGVRIGVTIAKTLAWSLDIPVVGVSSLAVLASSGRYFEGLISPLFDARRGQLYTGLYKFNEGKLECLIEDANLPAEQWAEILSQYDQKVLFTGHDVKIHQEVLQSNLGNQAVFADMTSHNPRPSELIRLGMERPAENVHGLVPNYIRLAEAEAKWRESQK